MLPVYRGLRCHSAHTAFVSVTGDVHYTTVSLLKKGDEIRFPHKLPRVFHAEFTVFSKRVRLKLTRNKNVQTMVPVSLGRGSSIVPFQDTFPKVSNCYLPLS